MRCVPQGGACRQGQDMAKLKILSIGQQQSREREGDDKVEDKKREDVTGE